jgi:hypothetical protein
VAFRDWAEVAFKDLIITLKGKRKRKKGKKEKNMFLDVPQWEIHARSSLVVIGPSKPRKILSTFSGKVTGCTMTCLRT